MIKKNGFTMMETLLAVGIGTTIIAVAGSVYFMGVTTYRRKSLSAELVQNGRVAIDRMSREIRQTSEIAVDLPEEEIESLPSEIIFRNGHDAEEINYIKYYTDNGNLNREERFYYFSSDPDKTRVVCGAIGDSGEIPVWEVVKDQVIAENISNLGFFGGPLVHMNLILSKLDLNLYLATAVLGRDID
ncbi:hypothetical protein D4R87_02310 [bacterium]|nr:MAG: hypothetical protein D4R87_02310 [bacterium]